MSCNTNALTMKKYYLLAAIAYFSTSVLFGQFIDKFPYITSFEEEKSDWVGDGDWERGYSFYFEKQPNTGNIAWVTKVTSFYTNLTKSALTSPRFDISNLQNPYVSFSISHYTESCCDKLSFQYSTDDINWQAVPTGNTTVGWNGSSFSGNSTFYDSASTSLEQISTLDSIRFRFFFETNASSNNVGVAIDDFIIADRPSNSISDMEALGLVDLESFGCGKNLGFAYQNNSNQFIPFLLVRHMGKSGFIRTEILRNIPPYGAGILTLFGSYFNEDVTSWMATNDINKSNDTLKTFASINTPIDLQIEPWRKNTLLDCTNDSISIDILITNLHQNTLFNVPLHIQIADTTIIMTLDSVRSFCQFSRIPVRIRLENFLTQFGVYPSNIICSLSSDTINSNDTVPFNLQYSKTFDLPYFENFSSAKSATLIDGQIAGDEFPLGWSVTQDYSSKPVIGSEQLSLLSFPSYGYGGKDNYMAIPASIFGADTAFSPCINLPNSSDTVILEFYYYNWFESFALNSYALFIKDVSNNRTSSIPLGLLRQQNQEDNFFKAAISLSQFNGQTIKFALLNFGSFSSPSSWLHVDNFKIYSSNSNDLSIRSINNFSGSECGLLSDSSINVTIDNFGSNSITSFDLCYQVEGLNPVCESINSGVLSPNSSTNYTFNKKLDISSTNTYLIKAYTKLSSDATTTNDTAFSRFDNTTTILPYNEDFDSIFVVNKGGIWIRNFDPSSNFYWNTAKGPTPSFNTGPITDANGQTDGIYFYVETENGSLKGDSAVLFTTNCFAFNGNNDMVFEYKYHMYGSTMGELYLVAIENQDTIVLDSIKGQQQMAASDPWKSKRISLNPLQNKAVRFAFIAIAGNGEQSDMAIDNIAVRDSTTGLSEYGIEQSILLYPNPTNGLININLNNNKLNFEETEIRVINLMGKAIHREQIQAQQQLLNLQHLPVGVYILEINSKEGVLRKKFVLK